MSAREPLTIPEAMASLREQLTSAIEDADGERLRFAVNQVEVELQLSVTVTRRGEAKVALWTVLSAGGGADAASGQVHRVKLTLTPTLQPPAEDDPRVYISDEDELVGLPAATPEPDIPHVPADFNDHSSPPRATDPSGQFEPS